MSGTPKYQSAEFTVERQRQEEESRRQREAEQMKRAMEVKLKLDREIVISARNEGYEIGDTFDTMASQFAKESSYKYISESEFEKIKVEQFHAKTKLSNIASTDAEAAKSALQLARVSFIRLQSLVNKAKEAEELAKIEAIKQQKREYYKSLEALIQKNCDEGNTISSARFDKEGWTNFISLQSQAAKFFSSDSLELAINYATKAIEKFTEHIRVSEENKTKLVYKKESVGIYHQQVLSSLEQILTEEAMQWQNESLLNQKEIIKKVGDMLSFEVNFIKSTGKECESLLDTINSKITEIENQILAIVILANERQALEQKRLAIVDAVTRSLQDLGYIVYEKELECKNDKDSNWLVAAATNNTEFDIKIPLSANELIYEAHSFETHSVESSNGDKEITCDALENRINELIPEMLGKGVDMGELKWAGKPENKRVEDAKKIPKNNLNKTNTN